MLRSNATALRRWLSTAQSVILSLVLSLVLIPMLGHAQSWTGLGADGKWSTTGNWSGGTLPGTGATLPTFNVNVNTTVINDLTGLPNLTGITFGASAGAFVVTGNSVNLGGDFTSSTPLQVNYNAPIVLISAVARNFNVSNSAGELVIGASVSGTGSILTKVGRGLLTLTASNSYTGGTDVQDGILSVAGASGSLPTATSITISNGATLRLLNTATANNTNRLVDAQAISMNSGKFAFSQTGGAVNYSETAGVLTLTGGVNSVSSSQADAGQTSTITFASINRTGGVVDFSGTGLGDDTRNRIVFTSVPNNDGIIGGYATVGSEFAKYDTTLGSVRSMQAADYVTTEQDTWLSSSNVKLTASPTALAANRQINSLNLPAASPTLINLATRTLRVESGGILVSGTQPVSFLYGTLTAGEGNNTAGNLILHQNSSSTLTLGARITNNGTAAVSLTKAGPGNLTLTEANTYGGVTQVYAGTLRNGVTNALPATTALTMGDSSGTAASLDMTGVSQTLTGLSVVGNTSAAHVFTVTAGETMTINGNLSVGANVAAVTTNTTFNGGGSLVVNNAGGLIAVGLATGNINSNSATLDLTGLSSLNVNLGTTGTTTTSLFRVGDNNGTSGSGTSVVKLPTNTTITALRISVGAEAGTLLNQTLSLGNGTTVFNTGTLDLSTSSTSAGARGIGILNFSTANGTLKLRGTDGISATSTMNVGFATVSTTSGNLAGSFDSRGHKADLLVTSLNIAGRNAGTGAMTATFDFDNGTLTAATTNIGQKAGANTYTGVLTGTATLAGGTVSLGAVTLATNATATGTATGNLTLSGATVGISSLTMASATTAGGIATANLNLTGGIVTLAGGITRAGGAGTSNAIITLNGSTLDMGGFAIGTAASSVTLIAQSGILKNTGTINGVGGLAKTGTGTLELQGSNSYSGPTTVSAGILKIAAISDGGAPSTLGSSASDSAGIVLNGGTLQYTGGTGSSNRLFSVGTTAGSALDASGTGALSLGATGNIGLNGQTGTRTLVLTGTSADANLLAANLVDDGANASSLTKNGIGTWVLTGTHGYTGATTVNAGTLRLDFSGTGAPSTNIIGSNSALVMGGGTLEVKGASGGSPTQAFASLSVNTGASVLLASLNGAASVSVNFGGASIARSAGASLNFLAAATNSFTSTNAVNNAAGILGGYALVNGSNWAARDGSGNITDFTGYTPLTTAATTATTTNYILSGGQSQLGAVSVNSLKLTGTGTLALGTNALTFAGAAGGLLYAPVQGTDGYNITGSAVVGAGTTSEFIVSISQGTLNIANPLISTTATAGSLTKAGAGTLISTGTSAYTGTTWVNGGVLEISGTGTITSSTGLTVGSGGTLRLNSANAAGAVADASAITVTGTLEVRANETIGGLAGTGTVTNNGASSAVLNVNSATTTSFTGVFQDGSTGTLGLTKSGVGAYTLGGSGSNLSTGITTVAGGTLSLAKTGGALAISGNVTVGDGLGAADILILNGSEQIANTSVVTVTGSSFSGVLRLNGYTETIGGLSTTGSAPASALVDNGLLGTTGRLILNTLTDQDYGGAIQNGTGTGSLLALTKTGVAQQALSGGGNNTFTGGIMVLGGTLKLSKTAGVNAVPAGALVVGDGTASAVVQWTAGNQIADTVVPVLAGTGASAGVLRLFGRVETIGGLSSNPTLGGGIVENELGSVGTATLTLNLATNTTQIFTGIVRDGDGIGTDGSLAIVKSGNGIQVFTNDNTYSGGTTISAGTLVIGNGGASGTLGSGAIINNGTLGIDRTGSLAIGAGQAITGTGSLILGGSQTLTLSGTANTYSGDTIIDQGTLVVTNASGSATGTGTVYVANAAALAGTGIIGGGVTVNLGGTLTVGNVSGDATGKVLQINGPLGNSGTLSFDLWANTNGTNPMANADVLKFGGSGVGAFGLGGTLSVNGNSINNYQAGDQWLLFDWGSIAISDRNVTFTALNLPTLAGGLAFDTSTLGTTGYLSIIAVPEPSRILLIAVGLAAVMMRRRRMVSQ